MKRLQDFLINIEENDCQKESAQCQKNKGKPEKIEVPFRIILRPYTFSQRGNGIVKAGVVGGSTAELFNFIQQNEIGSALCLVGQACCGKE